MLRVYDDYLECVRKLRGAVTAIERRDVDLARQLRRAAASVALNMAEASGNHGGTRRQRYLSALGSARETIACLQVAEAFGYITPDPAILRALHGIVGALTSVAR